MNYLITGGKGFIGSHLANKLALKKDNKVYVLDNLSSSCRNELKKKIIFFFGNVSDKKLLKYIISKKKINIIYHLAAKINESQSKENPSLDVKTTINSTINILEILKQYPKIKIIFGSTVAVYGKSNNLKFSEKSKTNPELSYSISKKNAEDYINYYEKYYKLETSIIRIGNVYGPYQSQLGDVGVINIFIKNMLKNRPIEIYGTGKQSRDFIYIDDVVDFLIYAKKTKGIYNLSSGKSYSINYLAKTILNKNKLIKIKKRKKGRVEEVGNIKINISKSNKSGWKPKINLKNGLDKTIKFYDKYRSLL